MLDLSFVDDAAEGLENAEEIANKQRLVVSNFLVVRTEYSLGSNASTVGLAPRSAPVFETIFQAIVKLRCIYLFVVVFSWCIGRVFCAFLLPVVLKFEAPFQI